MSYEPNSFGGPVEDPSVKEPPLKISGDADRNTTIRRRVILAKGLDLPLPKMS